MIINPSSHWTFLGKGLLGSAAIRTPLVSWAGVYHQLLFEYYIAGYSGAAVARLIVGPASGLSETGTTFCSSMIENVTLTTTAVSIPGWPTAVTVAAVSRWGHAYVQNIANQVKLMNGWGQYAGTAATVAPTQIKKSGMFSDSTNSIQQAELAVYAAITGTAISSTTLNAGSYLIAWGRNDN